MGLLVNIFKLYTQGKYMTNYHSFVSRKIKAQIIDGPERGKWLTITALFDSYKQARNLINNGTLLLSPTTSSSGRLKTFFKPHGAHESQKTSPLPYVGLEAYTRRKPGCQPFDFRHIAFINADKRKCELASVPGPIQTTIPFVVEKHKTPPKVATKPVSITKTDIKQVLGLHMPKLPMAIPAVHVVINNCRVSGTAEDVAKLLKQM